MRKTPHLAMVIAAVVVVLTVGAVSAYAGLADDVTPPTTSSDAVATYWNDATVHLTAVDDEGVAYIYSELDEGVARLFRVNGGAAETDAPHEWYHPLKTGEHSIKFWSQDVNGNVETPQSVKFMVKADKTAPVTAVSGATDGGWYRKTLDLGLSATDAGDGSGVASLQYALDDGAPMIVAAAVAPVSIAVDAATANGPHVLAYSATDVAGNVEAKKTITVNVDTSRPTTSAPSAASVVRGRTATLKYRVRDAAPNGGKAAVVIKVKNRAGKVVKTLKTGKVAVNKTLSKKFTCKLAKGRYTFSVYATDLAGNTQAKVGSNRLVVK